MSPITLLPRGPTLGTMPAAIGLALMTTEIRLAAALSRTLPVALPALFHRNAAALLDLILLVELIVLATRIALLVIEFLFLETARLAATPPGFVVLATAYLGGYGAGFGPVHAGLTALATAALYAAIAWNAQNMRTRRETVPDHRVCFSKS